MANMPETVRRRMPIATFALIGISVLLAIIMFCATGSFNPDPRDFIDYGANFRRLTFGGQLWRLVTSSFLHFGLEHLAFNMLCLFALGKFLEKMVGHANLLCVYLLTACTGGILSMCFHDNTVCAGASGAVMKNIECSELAEVIRSVVAGETVIASEIHKNLKAAPPIKDLTERQRQILTDMVEGRTDAEIAKSLKLSSNSVRDHITAIFNKLGADNRADAVSIALRKHLLKI